MGYGPEAIKKTRQVIDRVAQGGTVKRLAREIGISQFTFNEVVLGDSEMALLYARARETRADLDADEIIHIADDPDRDPQQARNMIEARKWRATKQHPRVYGDRIDVNLQGSISISETLSQARGRLIPRVEQDILDVDALEVPTLELIDAKEDDIFS